MQNLQKQSTVINLLPSSPSPASPSQVVDNPRSSMANCATNVTVYLQIENLLKLDTPHPPFRPIQLISCNPCLHLLITVPLKTLCLLMYLHLP